VYLVGLYTHSGVQLVWKSALPKEAFILLRPILFHFCVFGAVSTQTVY
jgi:hypothetical protein